MDTQSYRKENKGALYEHPCLLYEAKNGKVKMKTGTNPFYPPPPPAGTLSEPDVKLGSLTLIRHKMTLSHFSKGLIRPVSGGQ